MKILNIIGGIALTSQVTKKPLIKPTIQGNTINESFIKTHPIQNEIKTNTESDKSLSVSILGVVAMALAGIAWCLFKTQNNDDNVINVELQYNYMNDHIIINDAPNHAININEIHVDNVDNVNHDIEIIIQIENQIAMLQNLIAQQAEQKAGHKHTAIQ